MANAKIPNVGGSNGGNGRVVGPGSVAACRGLQFAGVMAWEGGRIAGMDPPEEKRKPIEAAVGRLTGSADRCRQACLPVEIVSCGGTGTYPVASKLPGVTKIQAGGGIFGDIQSRRHYGVEHEYGLAILTTVVSRPTPTRIVCDAGWKSMNPQPALPEPLNFGKVASLESRSGTCDN